MISLIDSEPPEPRESTPASPEDIAFWKDVFSVLLPEDERPASAQDD